MNDIVIVLNVSKRIYEKGAKFRTKGGAESATSPIKYLRSKMIQSSIEIP